MIDEWGLRGVTSNPTIFEKAIAQTDQYDADIARFVSAASNAEQLYETLAIADVRAAADTLRGVYEQTDGRDGFVSSRCRRTWRGIAQLAALGIEIEAVAARLLEEGIAKFVQPYDSLLAALATRSARHR
jgi:transaldolase